MGAFILAIGKGWKAKGEGLMVKGERFSTVPRSILKAYLIFLYILSLSP
jgi:hypothetical protein